MNRFWNFVTRAAAPFAVLALLLALVLTVWTVTDNRGLTQCVDRWATAYVSASNQRATAHDAVQVALDTLIRAVPTTRSPAGAATFEHALSAYIAASNAERVAEKRHPLPVAPTLDC